LRQLTEDVLPEILDKDHQIQDGQGIPELYVPLLLNFAALTQAGHFPGAGTSRSSGWHT
jgi:hypothetical protein